MTLELLTEEDLTPEESEALWDQGVCMDDWDFLLLVPPDAVTDVYAERGNGWGTVWHASDDGPCWPCGPLAQELDSLVRGVYQSRWYRVTFRGALRGLGVPYHA